MTGCHEVVDGVADAVVTTQSGNVNLIDIAALDDAEQTLRALLVSHDGVFVDCHVIAFRQYRRTGFLLVDSLEDGLVYAGAVAELHAVDRPHTAIVLE